jgi:single-strand DNA-binding protein
MAGSVNQVTLLGNLCKDPEIRSTQDGRKIANMTIATSERWMVKGTGEQKERSEFHRIVIFNEHSARVAERFLRKGSKVYVQGSLHTRKWADQQGVERYSTEIEIGGFDGKVVLVGDYDRGNDSWDEGGQPNNRRASLRRVGLQGNKQSWDGTGSDLDDPIPF